MSDNPTTIEEFVELQELDVDPYAVLAFGVGALPKTLHTPETPVLSIWLRGVQAPLIATYVSIEERDEDLVKLREAVRKR